MDPKPALRFLLFTSVLMVADARAQGVLGSIHAEGMQRLSEAAVINASGLHVGEPFSEKALNGAAQRLVDSGFFTSANYSYAPVTGKGKLAYAVTLTIREDNAQPIPVVLDLPGVDASAMWGELKRQDPLLDPKMPDNDEASAYYQHAIETALAKTGHPTTLIVKRSVDLATRKSLAIFRPVNAPKLMAVNFSGNRVIASTQLEHAIHSIVIGQDYSEMDLREVMRLNLTPLYEERGYLRVTYRQITVAQQNGAVEASVAVEEGRSWNLGSVEIEGRELPVSDMQQSARFPIGQLANWKQISQSMEDMQRPLRASGYLARRVAEPERTFDDAAGAVALRIHVDKGPQFVFGQLILTGLPAEAEGHLRKSWKLAAGAPYDELYGMTFYKELLDNLPGQRLKISMEVRPEPGNTRAMDVVVAASPAS